MLWWSQQVDALLEKPPEERLLRELSWVAKGRLGDSGEATGRARILSCVLVDYIFEGEEEEEEALCLSEERGNEQRYCSR